MLISGGKVLAIDEVKHDETLTGNGCFDPLGVNTSAFSRAVFFMGNLGNNSYSNYFSLNNNILSASPDVKCFNIAINYQVQPNNSANQDLSYSSNVCFNDHDNIKYTHGFVNSENYNYSYNIQNIQNIYEFNIQHDMEIDVKNVNISCIGFIGYEDEKPTEIVNVLGTENCDIISFGNIALRV